MGHITGFRLRGTGGATKALPPAYRDADARDRLLEKVRTMGEAFFGMSEGEYGDWLNGLPQDEFIELIALE